MKEKELRSKLARLKIYGNESYFEIIGLLIDKEGNKKQKAPSQDQESDLEEEEDVEEGNTIMDQENGHCIVVADSE